MIILKNIKKSYVPKKGRTVDALKDINLHLDGKGLVFLIGKSGSGKSTLMNLIGGLDHADAGSITVHDKDITTFNQNEYDSYRNTHIGFIFQEFNLIESYTVYKNIALAYELQGKHASRDEISALLAELDLSEEIDRMPYELSGGQKQRVSIARALIKKPKILLADEPTGSLDSDTGKQIFTLLKRLSKEQLVVVVSHDKEYAQTYGDRIVELADGLIIHDSALNSVPTVSEESLSFVKSKLPLKDAAILGIRSLGRKPFRMALTILLSVFAFSMFAITDTLASYNKNAVIINALHAQERTELILSRRVINTFDSYQMVSNFSQIHFDALQAAHSSYSMTKVLDANNGLGLENVYNPDFNNEYYMDSFSGTVELTQTFVDQMGYTLFGDFPQSDSELVITKHMFQNYKTFGYRDNGKVVIETFEDIIGKTTNGRVIVGVLDTNFDEERYKLLLDSSTSWDHNFALTREMWQLKEGSVHSYFYVNPGYIDHFILTNPITEINLDFGGISIYQGTKNDPYSMNEYSDTVASIREIRQTNALPADIDLFEEFQGITELTGNQVLIGFDSIYTQAMSFYFNDYEDLKAARAIEAIEYYAQTRYHEVQSQFTEWNEGATWEDYAVYLKSVNRSQYVQHDDYRRDRITVRAGQELAREHLDTLEGYRTLSMQINNSIDSLSHREDVQVVGYFEGQGLLVATPFYESLIERLGLSEFRQVIVRLSDNQQADINFLNEVNKQHIIFDESTEIGFVLRYADNTLSLFTGIILGVGAGLAVFACVLLFNFISISISHKKKDIGILRSLGARQKDVFMIFLAEALIVATIIYVLALIVSFIAVTIFDGYITNNFMLNASIIWVSIRQALLLFGVTYLISIVSTWLPIMKFARQKPIDVIKTV